MKYSLLFVTVLAVSTFLLVDAKKKPNNKYEGDFEFVDEVNDDIFEEWMDINKHVLLATHNGMEYNTLWSESQVDRNIILINLIFLEILSFIRERVRPG